MKNRNDVSGYLAQLSKWGAVEVVQESGVADAIFKWALPKETLTCVLELKNYLSSANINVVASQFEKNIQLQLGRKYLLAAPFIRRSQAKLLESKKIDHLDMAGNIHIVTENTFIHVEGKQEITSNDKFIGRALKRSGLQILYVLLIKPESVNWPYRQIAEAANVVHGSVAIVLKDLRLRGYLFGSDGRAKLLRRKELMGQWVQGYISTLRPKLIVGRYRPQFKDFEDVIKKFEQYYTVGVNQWALTGAQAAYREFKYYSVDKLTFFADSLDFGNVLENQNMLAALRWIPDPSGNITQLRFFSKYVVSDAVGDVMPSTHPLITYAELINDDTDRSKEAADQVYERYLHAIENDDR